MLAGTGGRHGWESLIRLTFGSVSRGKLRAGSHGAQQLDVTMSARALRVKLADRVSRTGSAKPARQGRPPGGGKLAPHLTTLLEWVETSALTSRCRNWRPN